MGISVLSVPTYLVSLGCCPVPKLPKKRSLENKKVHERGAKNGREKGASETPRLLERAKSFCRITEHWRRKAREIK
jgi:hypothetical protein